jgi:CheY-like chemotaxis protein
MATTVLIVDDSLVFRAHILDLLGKSRPSWTLLEAPDMPTGLALLGERSDIDLLLTDFQLGPQQSGFDLLELARTFHPHVAGWWQNLSKVLMTDGGKLAPTDLPRLTGYGARLLPKPTPQTVDTFLAALDETLAK